MPKPKYTTRKPPGGSTPVEALQHGDKRKNIPTAELHDFMEKYEAAPPTMLYPRDPSLDPQLVWKGKDEQDREDLAVPVVPIYIQEKIQPRAIIENVRAQARVGHPEQMNLFADFNGIQFEELIEFYQHEQNWSNRMILGDSLYVMTSLAEKEGLKGKVQMIYVDPPYGISFGSNWQVSTRKRDVKDGRVEDMAREPEVVKAFRDTWELGIHSYLSYLRDRFIAARALLTETGSIFVQIGQENVHLVRNVMDEVFGSGNFINQIGFMKTAGLESDYLANVNDYLLWYGKDRSQTKSRRIYAAKYVGGERASQYNWIEEADGQVRPLTGTEIAEWEAGKSQDGRVFSHQSAYTAGRRKQLTSSSSGMGSRSPCLRVNAGEHCPKGCCAWGGPVAF